MVPNEDEALAGLIDETGEDGAAGHEDLSQDTPEEQHPHQAGTVPVGVVAELRRQNRELKQELQSFRQEFSTGIAALRPVAAEAPDPWKDLRGMTAAELADYADEGTTESRRVAQFNRVVEEEREDRIAEKTAQRLQKSQESSELNVTAAAFDTLKEANPWLAQPGAMRAMADAYYGQARTDGKPPKEALRVMIREMAPILTAKGLKISGLDRVDPEFLSQITGRRAPAEAQVESLDAMGSGRASRGRGASLPPTATASNRTLVKAYADMDKDEREEWLSSNE